MRTERVTRLAERTISPLPFRTWAGNEAGNSVPGLLGGALVIVCRYPGRGPQTFKDVRKRRKHELEGTGPVDVMARNPSSEDHRVLVERAS